MGIEKAQGMQRRARADEFSRKVAKVAVAQICEGLGFHEIRETALESLADIAFHYVLLLGKGANSYAALNGRSESNLFDIVLGLEELGSVSGKPRVCVVKSGKLKDIADYIRSSEQNQVPFAHPIPRYPVVSDASRNRIPSFCVMGESPPNKHIPDWLPAFPDPHTYRQTPVWLERNSDARADKVEQAKQRRKGERALLSLQQRLVAKGANPSSPWGDIHYSKQTLGEAEAKPYATLKDELGNGIKGSLLETFGAAIEAAKDGICDGGQLKGRGAGAICFKLRTRKKLLEDPLELSLWNKGESKLVPSVREDERDDKRKRAEFILRQCIENPMDLNQL